MSASPIRVTLVAQDKALAAISRISDEAKVYALRRAVAIDATHQACGYCGGQSEKADHHVENILPALCRVLGITEVQLAKMRPPIDTSE